MAVYQSGSVSGVVALLDQIRAFALAQGWTINQNAADGSGQRLHISLGPAYFNFRALVNETPQGGPSGVYGIHGYGSTGHNAGSPWYDQPGGPKYGTSPVVYNYSGFVQLGSVGTPSPTLSYHFFSFDRNNTPKTLAVTGATNASPIVITATGHRMETGDRVSISGVGGNTAANGKWTITRVDANSFSLQGSTGNGAYTSGGSIEMLAECIYVVVEYPTGDFQHLLFGTLDKSRAGQYAGGQFWSSQTWYNVNTVGWPVNFFGRGITFGFQTRNPPTGMVYATVDGITGWKMWPNGSNASYNANQYVQDNVGKLQNRFNCAPNAINAQVIGDPVSVAVTRDGTATYAATTPWSIIGHLPGLYFANIKTVVPASEIAIGSTTYRAFPMFRKDDAAFNVLTAPTQHIGFFVRSN